MSLLLKTEGVSSVSCKIYSHESYQVVFRAKQVHAGVMQAGNIHNLLLHLPTSVSIEVQRKAAVIICILLRKLSRVSADWYLLICSNKSQIASGEPSKSISGT